MNPSSPARPAAPMAAASMAPGEAALAATLRAMRQDPVACRTLMAWQATATDAVTAAIDSLTQQLAGAAMPQAPAAADRYDVIQARAQARRRQAHLEQCRQLAQEMVLASLHHLDDPHWDPLGEQQEASGGPTAPANLLAMLLTEPPEPG